MALPLDALWFVILILFLAVFCTAYLMSARLWLSLSLVVLVIGLVLTVISVITRRKRERVEAAIVESEMLEYLKTHGIKGNLSQLADALNITREDALLLLTSLEEQGTIPPGSAQAFGANPPDT